MAGVTVSNPGDDSDDFEYSDTEDNNTSTTGLVSHLYPRPGSVLTTTSLETGADQFQGVTPIPGHRRGELMKPTAPSKHRTQSLDTELVSTHQADLHRRVLFDQGRATPSHGIRNQVYNQLQAYHHQLRKQHQPSAQLENLAPSKILPAGSQELSSDGTRFESKPFEGRQVGPALGQSFHVAGQSNIYYRGEPGSAAGQGDDPAAPAASAAGHLDQDLRPVQELGSVGAVMFPNFKFFNKVQSQVLDCVFYTNRSVVVAAPTGSGKTGVFEIALAKEIANTVLNDKEKDLLQEETGESYSLKNVQRSPSFRVVYIAPTKSLCSERANDWVSKLTQSLGMKVLELTGDFMCEELESIKSSSVIITTPEKWDAVSRRFHDKQEIIESIKLVIIDEVHLLNDEHRGHVLEAIVSRLKVLRCPARFVAVSATFPNIEDIAEWLGGDQAQHFNFGEDFRPVQLKRVVIGYPFYKGQSEFKFEMNLSYRLGQIIESHGKGNPCLVFCYSRKSTMHTAAILSQEFKATFSSEKKALIISSAEKITDSKLRSLILDFGIGYHHAGLDFQDRQTVEYLFSNNLLAVLTCTTTLSQGVNLPAHLVVIKSTMQVCNGGWKEYGENLILQMSGRAGRPQHCSQATVVIMTEMSKKSYYERLISGSQRVESNLHNHLQEHLNSEIILGTIQSCADAADWIKMSFLFVRMIKNPSRYSVNSSEPGFDINQYLYSICSQAMEEMAAAEVILLDFNEKVSGTSSGRLMSRYYLTFDTMKKFSSLEGNETMPQLLETITENKEFKDVVLRIGEKKFLNDLSSGKAAKIRFKLGKIKTPAMKVNALIQAVLGVNSITDSSLGLEAPRLVQLASRICNALTEYVLSSKRLSKQLTLVMNTVNLNKSLTAGIWDNSPHVAKQMQRIGIVISNQLVAAGFTNLQLLANANPREIEMVCNKCPPFGNSVKTFAQSTPQYRLNVDGKSDKNNTELTVLLSLQNIAEFRKSAIDDKGWHLIIGNGGSVLSRIRGSNSLLLNSGSTWQKKITFPSSECTEQLINIFLVHDSLVGVDVTSEFMLPWQVFRNQLYAEPYQRDHMTLQSQYETHQADDGGFYDQVSTTVETAPLGVYENRGELGGGRMARFTKSNRAALRGELPIEWYEYHKKMNQAYIDESVLSNCYNSKQVHDGYREDLPPEWYEHQASARELASESGHNSQFHVAPSDTDQTDQENRSSYGHNNEHDFEYDDRDQQWSAVEGVAGGSSYVDQLYDEQQAGDHQWSAVEGVAGCSNYADHLYDEQQAGDQLYREDVFSSRYGYPTQYDDQANQDYSFGNSEVSETFGSGGSLYRACKHSCANKQSCAHLCCKLGKKVKQQRYQGISSKIKGIINEFHRRGARPRGGSRWLGGGRMARLTASRAALRGRRGNFY